MSCIRVAMPSTRLFMEPFQNLLLDLVVAEVRVPTANVLPLHGLRELVELGLAELPRKIRIEQRAEGLPETGRGDAARSTDPPRPVPHLPHQDTDALQTVAFNRVMA